MFKINNYWNFIYGYVNYDNLGGASGKLIILNGNDQFSVSPIGYQSSILVTNVSLGNVYVGGYNGIASTFYLANPILFYNNLPPIASLDDYYFLAVGDIGNI